MNKTREKLYDLVRAGHPHGGKGCHHCDNIVNAILASVYLKIEFVEPKFRARMRDCDERWGVYNATLPLSEFAVFNSEDDANEYAAWLNSKESK